MRKFWIGLGRVLVTIVFTLVLSLLIDFMLAAYELRLGGLLRLALLYFCWFLSKKIIKNPDDVVAPFPSQKGEENAE